MSKKLINLSNLQKFLLNLNEKFALKKAMKGITEDSEGNIIIGEEGLVPTPDENSKGKFLRSDGTWSIPGDSPLYEPMTQEEGIEGVSEVNKVLSAKTLKAVVEDEISTNENVVHTSGNEEVGGVKTFTENMYIKRDGPRMRLQDTRCAKGTTPESSLYNQALYVFDTNHVAYGGLEHSYLNDASNQISMISFSGTTNDNVDYAKITVGYDKNGKWYTYAPTPADTDKSTKIATTEFVSKKDENVVHKSGNETIDGTKTFTNQLYLGAGGGSYGLISAKDTNSILRLFGGTSPSTGANLDLYGEDLSDGGFSLRARTSDKIVGLDGKIDGTLKWNGKNVALDENLVHTTGREVISGDKIFQNAIYRQADITTSTVGEVYRFTDTNATPCGAIYNRMHWHNNNVYNRLQSYNATSDKDMYFEVLSHNDGSGVVNTGGSVTNNKNLTTVTKATDVSYVATMGWVNNPATSTNVVHRSGEEFISGVKHFYNAIYSYQGVNVLNGAMDINTTPTSTIYSNIIFKDKNYQTTSYIQYGQQDSGIDFIGLFINDKSKNLHGIQLTTNKEVKPLANNTYNLGASERKWANVYATTFNGNLKGNADTATSANSATYATTQATTDNSTKIATTAWVRSYVDSVAGNNTVGSSVSAYWSNSSLVTATGQSSSGGYYPECYSEYVSKTPVVGTIYSGAQLYTVLNTYASATGSLNNNSIYVTNNKAQATLSNPLSSTAKYLCTTANTFSFRAYTASGNTSSVGTSSVVNATLTKSIFIRVE
jgi:hypothetical protein